MQIIKILKHRIGQVQTLSHELTRTKSEFSELKSQYEQLNTEYDRYRSTNTVHQPEAVPYQPAPELVPQIVIQKAARTRRAKTVTINPVPQVHQKEPSPRQASPPPKEPSPAPAQEEPIVIPQKTSPINEDLGDRISLDTFI